MSQISVALPVDPERAFALLEDPRSLRALVAGARRIRKFDPTWPEVGSAVHHSIGLPLLTVRDATVVTYCIPGQRLVLSAHLHLLGALTVEFDFASNPSGSLLTVTEYPSSGPVSLPGVRRMVDAAAAIRNAELGRRFVELVAKREALAAAADRNRPAPRSA